MRKRIYEIIEVAPEVDVFSNIYDILMMLSIFASIVPLAFLSDYRAFDIIDKVTVSIFIIDYLLRLFTADYKLNEGAKSFVKYPFTLWAIIDLLSILPSLTVLNSAFRLLKVARLLRTFKVFRITKAARYSNNLTVIMNVIKKEKSLLGTVAWLAVAYVLVLALIILNVEPETFSGGYFEAVYWATVSLTTMGYGDIYPVSEFGRAVTMLSSLVGIAIVAIPSGIITSGMIDELKKRDD